jgi:hypothetical protein
MLSNNNNMEKNLVKPCLSNLWKQKKKKFKKKKRERKEKKRKEEKRREKNGHIEQQNILQGSMKIIHHGYNTL